MIGIDEVKLGAMPEDGRAYCEVPTLNQGTIPCDWPEEIRFSDIVMVQPVACVGLIIIDLKIPAAMGNYDTSLPLLIPLTSQRRKGEILAVGQTKQSARSCDQWRGLIIMTIEGAQDPIQARVPHCDADARIGRVMRYG